MKFIACFVHALLFVAPVACGEASTTVSARSPAGASGGAFTQMHPSSDAVEPPHPSAATWPRHTREPQRSFDSSGLPDGRTDPDGTFFGRNSLPSGRVDAQGQYYDARGLPAGRASADGTLYDARGLPRGRVDDTGQIYGRQGIVVGRIGSDGTTIYGRQGLPVGRVDAPCNSDCRRDIAHRYLDEVDP